MKKRWYNCHIATMQNGQYSMIENGAIISNAHLIEWIGPEAECAVDSSIESIDLQGAWVTPGLIDCHTHSVFGGNRSREFEQRLNGVSYAEIAAQGGGIVSTVKATRAASEAELLALALKRIEHLRREGVTCIEIKSGYGLDLANERKMLRVIREIAAQLPLTVKSTCLAAHALPPEYQDRADEYIDHVCDIMLPSLHAEKLIDAVDAF